MTKPSGKDTTEETQPSLSKGEPWFLAIMVRVTADDVASSLPMPIQINNHFPCVDFCLGLIKTPTLWMRMLLDSEAAMNSDNKEYHQQAMYRCPDMVSEYLECGPDTKFDLVKLRVAVNSSSVADDCLNAIIRYKTPYFIASRPL